MSLLSIRGNLYAVWQYDQAGHAVATYDLPVGSVEGATADTLRTEAGSPDGSVWMGVHTAAASPVPMLKRINPLNGAVYQAITLAGLVAGTDTIASGNTLCLTIEGDFILTVNKTAANTVVRYGPDGTEKTVYSVPDTVASIALASDGNTLYWREAGTGHLNRWDLAADAALLPFADLGASWSGRFSLLPDGGVLAAMTLTTINAQRFTANAALLASYTPSDAFAQSHGMAAVYDPSLDQVYVLAQSGSGSVAGVLMAFPGLGTTFAHPNPLWSVRVPLFGSVGSTVNQLVMTPPFGSPNDNAATSTTTEPILRMRQCPHLSRLQLMQFHQRFLLVYNPGAGDEEVLFGIAWSDSGGQDGTFIPPVWISGGDQGQRNFRAYIDQLGSARDRVYQVRWNSQSPVALIGALLDVENGIS